MLVQRQSGVIEKGGKEKESKTEIEKREKHHGETNEVQHVRIEH